MLVEFIRRGISVVNIQRGSIISNWRFDRQSLAPPHSQPFLWRSAMSPMSRARALIILVVLCAVFFLPAPPVRADIGPPALPPGVTILPGEEPTQVRMLAETVVFEVQPATSEPLPNSLGAEIVAQARVTATFTMRNLGSQAESMAVRFPLDTWVMNYDEATMPEIDDLQAKVDFSPVATRHTQSAESVGEWSQAVDWSEFDVTFPPGQDVIIEVTYTADATAFTTQGGEQTMSFDYILETGAGWKDTIGSADIIMRMPYSVSPENVFVYGPPYTTFTLHENEIRWHFEDLEPTRQDNISTRMVSLPAWQAVLDARQAVQEDPDDAEAWGRLGMSIEDVLMSHHDYRTDPGAESLYNEASQAYKRCLELLPDDSMWHSTYASLLWNHYEAELWEVGADPSEAVQALRELQLAMQLDPANEDAFLFLCWINNQTDYVTGCGESCWTGCSFDQMVFLALTETPLPPTPIFQPSATPEPSATSSPEPSPTVLPTLVTQVPTQASPTAAPLPTTQPAANPTLTPPSNPANQLCQGNLGALLGLAGIVVVLKRKKG